MCERYQHIDGYYAEQAAAFEAGCQRSYEPRAEIVIPMRWIMVWFGSVSAIGLGVGSLIRWLV